MGWEIFLTKKDFFRKQAPLIIVPPTVKSSGSEVMVRAGCHVPTIRAYCCKSRIKKRNTRRTPCTRGRNGWIATTRGFRLRAPPVYLRWHAGQPWLAFRKICTTQSITWVRICKFLESDKCTILVAPEDGGRRPLRRIWRNPVLRCFLGVEGSGYRIYGIFRGIRGTVPYPGPEAQEIYLDRALKKLITIITFVMCAI